jgi:predicted nucleic acid-binding protein
LIVADTSLIAHLLMAVPQSALARRVVQLDSQWCAPPLWKSELLQVLFDALKRGALERSVAMAIARDASAAVTTVPSAPPEKVLELCLQSGCSAYDCEFVALAQERQIKLVTSDRKLVERFPSVAMLLSQFVGE